MVLYGLLEVLGPSGLGARLLASDRRAALRFARTFGAGGTAEGGRSAAEAPPGENGSATGNTARNSAENGARRRPAPSPEPSPEELRKAAARETLGMEASASMRDVTLAYRRMARLYHPDKVANLPEEDREAAEGRMKEINAAYSLLKHPTRYAGRA
ncbi:MAG: J domain-containing protein [Actinomycetota bacterium]|nr:J domain-containing protein [Actinomycetota bacterium]